MADRGDATYWGDKHKPFVPAWTNDVELTELADAIVRGVSICHAIIPDLRKLIEEVQQHPNTRLAEIGRDGKPTIDDLTAVVIRGGEIHVCDCSNLSVRVRLVVSSLFVDVEIESDEEDYFADFEGAHFYASVDLYRSQFSVRTDFSNTIFHAYAELQEVHCIERSGFSNARFCNSANFESAVFEEGAIFAYVTFTDDVHFTSARFNGNTFLSRPTFVGAKFDDLVYFNSVAFLGGVDYRDTAFARTVDFKDAIFIDAAHFSSIILVQRLLLDGANLARASRLSFDGAYLRPGSEITLPRDRLEHVELRKRANSRDWFEESELDKRSHTYRVWVWFVQYLIAVAAPWTEQMWPWLRRKLGIHSHGTLIRGEDSDDQAELRIAAAQYNLLRDNYRHQPSADELEDLCHFRYMDLRCKAGDLWRQVGPITGEHGKENRSNPLKVVQWLLVDGLLYWLIWRNCCGYLVRPIRPLATAFLVIILCWFIYGLGASDSTILYNGTLGENETAMTMWNGTALTPLYFSITTFTTLGYGDFAPTGWLRAVAGVQALLGVGLIALFTVSWGRKMIR